MRKPRLLEMVSDAIRVRHLSRKTEKAYRYYIRDFILSNRKRHPSAVGVREIKDFLIRRRASSY